MAISFELNTETERRLNDLAKRTGKTPAFHLQELIAHGIEDLENLYLAEAAMQRVACGKEPVYSSTQVRKNLGLADQPLSTTWPSRSRRKFDLHRLGIENVTNTKPNFSLHMTVAPAPFFKCFPNVGYSTGDSTSHIPALLERRLTDLGDKYLILHTAFKEIVTIVAAIKEKYDPLKNQLEVGEEYWQLLLFLNHFLFEARSVLDILAVTLHFIHQKKTPRSFNDIHAEGKHAQFFANDPLFHNCLIEAKRAQWAQHLLSRSREDSSLRDRIAHNTVARVAIHPSESGTELEFYITAPLDITHPMQPNKGAELIHIVTEIMEGTDKLLVGFRHNYTQKRVRTLLGIAPDTPGLFDD